MIKNLHHRLKLINSINVNNLPHEYCESKLMLLIESKKYKTLLKKFENITKNYPNDTNLLLYKGIASQCINKHKEAIEIFDLIINNNPQDLCAYSQKATVLQALGHHRDAIILFNDILKIDVDHERDVLTYEFLGDSYDKIYKYYDAIKCYEKSYDLDKSNKILLPLIGDKYYNLCEYSEALKYYKEANKYIKDSDIISAIGMCLIYLDKLDESLEFYNNYISNNDKCIDDVIIEWKRELEKNKISKINYSSDFYIGKKYFKNEKYNDAMKCFDNSIYLKENVVESYYYKIKLLRYDEMFEEAIKCCDEALIICVKDGYYALEISLMKIKSLWGMDMHQEVITLATEMLEKYSNCDELYYYKGMSLQDVGKINESIDCFRKAIYYYPKLDDIDYDAEELADMYFEMAISHDKLKNSVLKKRYIKKALETYDKPEIYKLD